MDRERSSSLEDSPVAEESLDSASPPRLPLEPMDPQVRSIQPGGGVCMRIELAWGSVRRAWLKTFRPRYVERMRRLRRGDHNACPHEVLDPRDTKFHRNQGGYYWAPEDDPFTWRDRLPFARAGLAELLLLGGGSIVLAVVLAFVSWPLALAPLVLAAEFFWFFRNPRRHPPQDAGLVLAPADGKIVLVEELEHDEFIGGPAVLIGIFLSVFNVHINRAPVASRVIGVSYRRGKMLNALRPESARLNERMTLRLEENAAPHRRYVVRQITGALARRIVCWSAPGDHLERGAQFGMIKLGSRTELVLPRDAALTLLAQVGTHVRAGETVLARYQSEAHDESETEES